MQLKLFIVPVKNLSLPEGEMNAFLRSHRVLAVRKEFVSDGENSFWTFCVEYLESAPASNPPPGGKLPKVDYKEVLKPDEFEVFSRLRDWRKGVAEAEGVPVYVVFTNEQLALRGQLMRLSYLQVGLVRGARRWAVLVTAQQPGQVPALAHPQPLRNPG